MSGSVRSPRFRWTTWMGAKQPLLLKPQYARFVSGGNRFRGSFRQAFERYRLAA
jgi:hypothetical protein